MCSHAPGTVMRFPKEESHLSIAALKGITYIASMEAFRSSSKFAPLLSKLQENSLVSFS